MKNHKRVKCLCILTIIFMISYSSVYCTETNNVASSNNIMFLYKANEEICGLTIGEYLESKRKNSNKIFTGTNKVDEAIFQFSAKYPNELEIIKIFTEKLKLKKKSFGSYVHYSNLLNTLQSQSHARYIGCDFYKTIQTNLNCNKKKELQLGKLFKRFYSPVNPATAGTSLALQQAINNMCPADAVKPSILNINDTYYSIYGDCSVVIHFYNTIWKENLIAIAPSDNLLFAVHYLKPPPTLQSCGVDANNVIWLADVEGNMAFFDTKKNIYLSYVARCGKNNKIRIPRRNQSSSIFVFDNSHYVECFVPSPDSVNISSLKKINDIPTLEITPNQQGISLPADTFQVLCSDTEKIVYITGKQAVINHRSNAENIEVNFDLKKNEIPVEGVFDETQQKVYLLARHKAKDENDVFQVRKTWDNMRLLTIDLSKKKGLSN